MKHYAEWKFSSSPRLKRKTQALTVLIFFLLDINVALPAMWLRSSRPAASDFFIVTGTGFTHHGRSAQVQKDFLMLLGNEGATGVHPDGGLYHPLDRQLRRSTQPCEPHQFLPPPFFKLILQKLKREMPRKFSEHLNHFSAAITIILYYCITIISYLRTITTVGK